MFWLLDFNPFVAFLAASASMTASAVSAVLAAWIGRTWEVLMARGARSMLRYALLGGVALGLAPGVGGSEQLLV